MVSNNIYSNMCLVGAMDRLWFHQIILLSQPNNISPIPQSLEEESMLFNNFQSPSLSSTSSSLGDEDIITETDSSSHTSDETNSPPRTPNDKKETRPKRSKSYSFNNSRSNRSHSSQSPRDRRSQSLSGSTNHLEKAMSCRSLGELELEEVKGFLDLGFTFEKENLSPRMISLIPGLQRLDSMSKDKGNKTEREEEKEEDHEENDRGVVIRPYLSEAWLIRRPSSPLLNLKVPRASEASDMKKHLKFWARIVASEIQQES